VTARTPRASIPAVGRNRTAGEFLDKATLVRTAADVADRVGWSEFTLSQVAKEVNRHVSSMYAHVNGLDDLRREITLLALDELSDAVWGAAIGHVGEEALGAIAVVLREYCEIHPGRMASIVLTKHGTDPEQVRRAERLAEPTRATLRSFGLSEPQVMHAHRIFSVTIWGFTQGERGELFPLGGVDETFGYVLELFFLALRSGTWPSVPAAPLG
jgi:AcrR family transcriptional regulator